MENEKDLKTGLILLRNESIKRGIFFEIMSKKWIYPLSEYMSETGNCENFWKCVCDQNNVGKIACCMTIEDLFFSHNCLFLWEATPQGWRYWNNVFKDLITTSLNVRLDELEKTRKNCIYGEN